jgi:hypothetical protein
VQPVIRSNISKQLLQHDTGVFACKVIGRLSNVHRHVSGLFPEAKQVARQPKGNTKVVETFRTTFRQSLKERRHLVDIPDSDGVGLQRSVLVTLALFHPKPESIHLIHPASLCKRLQCSLSVTHSRIVWMRCDSHHTSARQCRKVIVLELL